MRNAVSQWCSDCQSVSRKGARVAHDYQLVRQSGVRTEKKESLIILVFNRKALIKVVINFNSVNF